jgi:hypothetical protein
MKIALLLQGHFRTFEKTHHSWINALEDCEYDCYFTTWNIINSNTKSWHSNAIENQPELTNSQIELLKTYDPNVTINTQEFTEDEKNDLYAFSPYKTHIYKFEALKNTLQRIESSKEEKEYNMIICGRFDLEINSIKFKDITINEDEIKFGGRVDKEKGKYIHNLAATDLLYIFHPSKKELFYNLPVGLKNRKFTNAEEYITDFFFINFNKVIHSFIYDKDFEIIRLPQTDTVTPSFTINYNLLRRKR